MARAILAGAIGDRVLTSGHGREVDRTNRRSKSGLIDIVREAA
jgi:hypothetical protein